MTRQSAFWKCALASGLLTEQQLDAAMVALSPTDQPDEDAAAVPEDKRLADRLVDTGQLNIWQAQQLLEGRTKFTLGNYRIVDSLGQGGMGHVFKAEYGVPGETVAIKVLPRDRSTPEAIENFAREIKALAMLDHPKLVRAIAAGRDGSVHFLVTEFVRGCDLRKLVRRDGPLDMATAAHVISQVAEGLQHAHDQGLVHRDVKPGNVLVTPEGDAKLSDLGLAGPMAQDAENDPRFGKIVGTADYLSPDHISSPWNPTPAWDIYALGCTLYYAVTGKVPFPGGTSADKARAHCELRPLDPRRLNPALSSEFVDMMADMMAKDPQERIVSASEVVRRLAPWAGVFVAPSSGLTVSGEPPASPAARPAVPTAIALPPTVLPVAPPVVAPPILIAPPRLDPSRMQDTVTDFFELPEGVVHEPRSIPAANPAISPVAPGASKFALAATVALIGVALVGVLVGGWWLWTWLAGGGQ